MRFQQNGLKQEAGKLVLISTSLLIICGKGKELAEQWNSRSLYLCTRNDHLIPGLIFLWGSYNTQRSGNKAGQVVTLCKSNCITGSRYLPAFTLWKPLSERIPALCITSHDGKESSAACVHKFLFPPGENWC